MHIDQVTGLQMIGAFSLLSCLVNEANVVKEHSWCAHMYTHTDAYTDTRTNVHTHTHTPLTHTHLRICVQFTKVLIFNSWP